MGDDAKYTKRELFIAYNNHVNNCGVPPRFTNRDGKENERPLYHGYFENVYGEQFVFIYDYDKEEGIVYGGDCGWKTKIRVDTIPLQELHDCLAEQYRKEGKTLTDEQWAGFRKDHLDYGRATSMISMQVRPGEPEIVLQTHGSTLSQDELQWLKACWVATQMHRGIRDSKRKEKPA